MIFKIIDNDATNTIYFGTEVASGRLNRDEETYHKMYDLKKRPYLGPTSTDHELAFLMAN